MKFHVALLVYVIVGLFPSPVFAQGISDLKKKVDEFSQSYLKAFQNVRCDVEGRIGGKNDGVEFNNGSIAILNGVLPWNFPPEGAHRFSRVQKDSLEVVKIANSQYSFRLEKKGPEQRFGLDGLHPQFDNPDRKKIQLDPIFLAFSATESWALFGPIMVLDVTSIALLRGDNGVTCRIVEEVDPNKTVVEFEFPLNHPRGHEWAKVSFGSSGEILDYKVRAHAQVMYSHVIRYSQSEKRSGIQLPTEFRDVEDGTWFKLSNFQFGNNRMQEFTLSNYGIPEPQGATIIAGQYPYWLFGTLLGGVFLAVGVYLRNMKKREE